MAALPEVPDVPGVKHRYLEVERIRFHVAEAGDGEPLVMLHGWPQNWYMWRLLVAPLGERYRLIMPDLRGFGWSDAPQSGYSKERLASDVLALLDQLGVDRFRLRTRLGRADQLLHRASRELASGAADAAEHHPSMAVAAGAAAEPAQEHLRISKRARSWRSADARRSGTLLQGHGLGPGTHRCYQRRRPAYLRG